MRQELTAEDRATLCLFEAAMQFRTRRAGDHWQETAQQLTESTIRISGSSFLIFFGIMCRRFSVSNGARQKHRNQKRNAIRLSRGGRKVRLI
jgi:hypothetical protein